MYGEESERFERTRLKGLGLLYIHRPRENIIDSAEYTGCHAMQFVIIQGLQRRMRLAAARMIVKNDQ